MHVDQGTLESKFADLKTSLASSGAQTSDITYSEAGDRKQYTLTVKVQPSKFNSMMTALQTIGEVKDMSVNLEDVTQQYTDLNTRITDQEAELSRLYQLYNMSGNISDLLSVESEMTRVETNLDILKGEKQVMDSQIQLSTISITVYEDKPATSQLSLSLEGIGALFFTAISAAITVIVAAVGFLLPIAIVIGVIWLAFKALTGKKKVGPSKSEHTRIPPPE